MGQRGALLSVSLKPKPAVVSTEFSSKVLVNQNKSLRSQSLMVPSSGDPNTC